MATKYFIAPNAWGIFCGMDKTARIDSRTVAEVFEKQHKDVLKAIENLKKSVENIKAENSALIENTDNAGKNIKAQNCALIENADNAGKNIKTENSVLTENTDNSRKRLVQNYTDVSVMFIEKSYKAGTGKKYKCYEMNRKGFTLLSMGFTGKKALQFQMEYITRFDEMEEFIRDKLAYLEDNRLFTDAIKLYKEAHADNVIECKFVYANEQDLVNEIVLGLRAKAFKKRYGIPEKENSIRIYCTQEQINAIHRLQGLDASLLFQNMAYADRKTQLNKFADTLGLRIGTDAQEEELKKLEEKSA